MLLQLIIEHPQALGQIIKNTPTWVFGLFAALMALGLSQLRTRDVSAMRMGLTPVAMTGLSLWGTVSAFSASHLFVYVLLAWACGAALMLGLIGPTKAPAGTRYNAVDRTFTVPGSVIPMLLILGIFFTKYFVGVELAMKPSLATDDVYTLVVGGLYGLFSGTFAGRAARLWRLALKPAASASSATAPAAA